MRIACSLSLPDGTDPAAVQALSNELTDFVMACTKVMGVSVPPQMEFIYAAPLPAASPSVAAKRVPHLGRVT